VRRGQERNGFAQIIGLALLFLACATPAKAQAKSRHERGPWDISFWTAGATGAAIGNSFTREQVWTGGVFLGRTIRRGVGTGWHQFDLEYGVNLVPLFIYWGDATIRGGGFEPFVLRFSSTHTVRGATPFIEFGGGAMFTARNLPPDDTSTFNFTARAGGGVYLGRGNRKPWEVALHWYHISNGELAPYNPQFNSLQLSVAYHWYR
jgi:Lipid A 3-O-deacylase (PagL)